MPKERLTRTLLGCGLGLLLAAPGCRTRGKEVPAAAPYTNPSAAGAADPRVGFTQDARPATGQGFAGTNMQPGQLPQPGQFGPGSANNGQAADAGLQPAGYGSTGGSTTNPPLPGSRWGSETPVGGPPAGGAGMTGGADPSAAGSPVLPSAGMPQPQPPYQTPGDTLQEGYQGMSTTPR
ncbi:MAG TPA: hypothetical protein VG406_16155 [Isosphaeraceae bacterium]|jgi:hypothetical protein|nr:hypothetical protein [Isosphaeraceae bacterium]